jgi:hypothetical protein
MFMARDGFLKVGCAAPLVMCDASCFLLLCVLTDCVHERVVDVNDTSNGELPMVVL